MKALSTIAAAILLFFGGGCHSAPSVVVGHAPPARFADHPEFGAFVKQADGRFLGCYGSSLSVPGLDAIDVAKVAGQVFGIPGTSDYWQGEDDMAFNARAWKFAEEYNRWLLQHPETQKPNKAPEPTPGSVTSRADARLAPVPVVAHL